MYVHAYKNAKRNIEKIREQKVNLTANKYTFNTQNRNKYKRKC